MQRKLPFFNKYFENKVTLIKFAQFEEKRAIYESNDSVL